jgi:hypothetical protein
MAAVVALLLLLLLTAMLLGLGFVLVRAILFVVPSCADTLGGEEVVQCVTEVRSRIDPVLYSVEHCAVHFDTVVSDGGVVEHMHYVRHDLLDGHVDVLPCEEDARGHEFEDAGCD